MRKIWVFLLAAIALVLGGFGTFVYGGISGSFAGIRIACEVLDTAEGSGILDKTQRADVVERFVQQMRKSKSSPDAQSLKTLELFEQMKTGCPKLSGE